VQIGSKLLSHLYCESKSLGTRSHRAYKSINNSYKFYIVFLVVSYNRLILPSPYVLLWAPLERGTLPMNGSSENVENRELGNDAILNLREWWTRATGFKISRNPGSLRGLSMREFQTGGARCILALGASPKSWQSANRKRTSRRRSLWRSWTGGWVGANGGGQYSFWHNSACYEVVRESAEKYAIRFSLA